MPITIEKLRRWMLLAAALIVAGVAALLLFAAHERRKLLHDLPGKLGMDIQQQTNEFTYSQSVQGKTLFTLHAAKAVQMKSGGHIKLHDVTIILYGRKQDRADRIAGEEFDYDPSSGIAQAAGEVFLDLQAPAKAVAASVKSTAAADATKNLADSQNAGMVHVTTRGLVFQQKQGIASTDQEIVFQFGGGVTGHAHGARYDSGRGIITLDSSVAADTTLHGRPAHITAAHGELDRDTNLCVFTHATYTAQNETATADQAKVQLRTDGSTEHVETSGNVTFTLADGGTLRTPHAIVAMNAVSQPKDLQASGGVHYVDNQSNAKETRDANADAIAAHIFFDDHGVAQRAELSGGVHSLERERAKTATGWTERELKSASVEMLFRTDHGAATTLHDVKASGDAQIRMTSPAQRKTTKGSTPQSVSGIETTTWTGDTLSAVLNANATPQTIHGAGHTVLTQIAADGTTNESRGDTLDMQLHPQNRTGKQNKELASQIDRAVQQGRVMLTQTPAAKSKAQSMTAVADRAEYTGNDDALVLTGTPQGDPEITDGSLQVAAHRIRLLRGTGDALLTGNVRANYASGSQAPAHVIADHAEMHRAGQHAVFYSAGHSQRARLWQDASQIEAPVLDLDRAAQRLTASGDPQDAAAVHAVFTSAANPAQKKSGSVMRIVGRRMIYSTGVAAKGTAPTPRQADFTGGIVVESGDSKIKAQRAVIELAPAETAKAAKDQPKKNPSAAAPAPPMLSGNVQRIVASGQVTLEQNGRHGSGEQLVYTPSATPNPVPNPSAGETSNPAAASATPIKASGRFVLTGTAAAPPKLVDPAKGTLTGASLIFNSGDDSVVVSGGDAVPGRVHTELKGFR